MAYDIAFKEKGCSIKMSKSLVHGLAMNEMMCRFERWAKDCLIVGYNNITKGEKEPLPDYDVRLPEPVPVSAELSEASSSEWEDDVGKKRRAKKGVKPQTYATPSAKSPSKIPVSISNTPQAAATVRLKRSNSANTGNKAAASLVPSSTGRAQRSTSRLKQPASASKLTESAIKQKVEMEKQRALILQQQMREKEEKAARQRQQNLVTMVVEHKQKREEKERKVALTREQLEKEANEKRLRESAKKKEADRRRREIEESRRALQKRAEDSEAEKRAAEAAATRRAADEERAKREAQEAEVAKQIHDRIQQIHQKKSTSMLLNSSLAHRMQAAFNVSQATNQTIAAPPVAHNSLISENSESVVDVTGATDVVAVPVSESAKTAANQTINMNVTVNGNLTFNLPAASNANDSMLPPLPPPPPPAPKLVSYDISDLNSDADSDDERNPRKVIPDWAKGTNFVQALQAQYSKLRKYREREIMKTFRLCHTTVDLDQIFSGYPRHVIPKYVKRTSSAQWSSPPASKLNFSDSFWANASFSKSILEHKE